MEPAVIRRLARYEGRNLRFTDVAVADAEFILALRTDSRKNRFLSSVSDDLEAQRRWIAAYAELVGQAYFIVRDRSDVPLGTVRLYDAKGNSFSWGSWVLADPAPSTAALESAVMVYSLATKVWGFRHAHFQVHRANEGVVRFHERLGAVAVGGDAIEVHYRMAHERILSVLARYARYVPPMPGPSA